MEGAFREQQKQATSRKEGEVRIENPDKNRQDGDYVEYVEVK